MMKNSRFWVKFPKNSDSCPNCGADMELVQRMNYPFGRKSRGHSSHWNICRSCNYMEVADRKKEKKDMLRGGK